MMDDACFTGIALDTKHLGECKARDKGMASMKNWCGMGSIKSADLHPLDIIKLYSWLDEQKKTCISYFMNVFSKNDSSLE